MPTIEQLKDPEYAFQAGAEFAEAFGVTVDPLSQPQAYEEAMYKANPRTPNKLVRFQLEESAQVWPEDVTELIGEVSLELGILAHDYPFPEGAHYALILVAGGARDAMPDRGDGVAA